MLNNQNIIIKFSYCYFFIPRQRSCRSNIRLTRNTGRAAIGAICA